MTEELPTPEDLAAELADPTAGILMDQSGNVVRYLRESEMKVINQEGYIPCIPDTNPETGEWMCGVCGQPGESDCLVEPHTIVSRSDR